MGTLTSNTGMAFSKWYDSVHGEPSYQETFEAGAAWQAAQAAQPAPRRLTEAEITLLVEAYYDDVGIAPPDLIRQVEGLIFGDAQLRAAINAKESK